jgi:hypothetical protein
VLKLKEDIEHRLQKQAGSSCVAVCFDATVAFGDLEFDRFWPCAALLLMSKALLPMQLCPP